MPESPDSQIERDGFPGGIPPHPAERLVSVREYAHGELVRLTQAFIHEGCAWERLTPWRTEIQEMLDGFTQRKS